MLVIFQDPAWHPSVRHTAQVLCERGHTVEIVAKWVPGQREFLGAADFGSSSHLHFGALEAEGWRRWVEFGRFVAHVARVAHHLKPDCMIGYDMHGIAASYIASRFLPRTSLVYHNFDIADTLGLLHPAGALKRLELMGARRANVVIASSSGRADLLVKQAQLQRRPIVVANCQRLSNPPAPSGELTELFRRRGRDVGRIVLRIGRLGPHHAIEETIRSVVDWDTHWTLVLVGMPVPGYLRSLKKLVGELGIEDRVLFLTNASESLVADCLTMADVGIALYVPNSLNNRTMAGAGNKLNYYMSAGVPSVLPALPDFENLLRRYAVGASADPTSPTSIARAVRSLLTNETVFARCRSEALRAFQTEFNFETQFQIPCSLIESADLSVSQPTRYHAKESL